MRIRAPEASVLITDCAFANNVFYADSTNTGDALSGSLLFVDATEAHLDRLRLTRNAATLIWDKESDVLGGIVAISSSRSNSTAHSLLFADNLLHVALCKDLEGGLCSLQGFLPPQNVSLFRNSVFAGFPLSGKGGLLSWRRDLNDAAVLPRNISCVANAVRLESVRSMVLG